VNIFGEGDQTTSSMFSSNWTDPVPLFARYPNGVRSSKPVYNATTPGSIAGSVDELFDTTALIASIKRLVFSVSPILLMGSGLCFICQLKKIGRKLFALGLLSAFFGSMGELILLPLLNFLGSLPLWAVFGLLALIAVRLLHFILVLFLGSGAADFATGNLVAGLFRHLVLALMAPLKALRRMLPGP
jgi:hypothetical protein